MLACGPGYRRLDLVNPAPDGGFWHPMQFTNGYRRLMVKLGFPAAVALIERLCGLSFEPAEGAVPPIRDTFVIFQPVRRVKSRGNAVK